MSNQKVELKEENTKLKPVEIETKQTQNNDTEQLIMSLYKDTYPKDEMPNLFKVNSRKSWSNYVGFGNLSISMSHENDNKKLYFKNKGYLKDISI